GDGGVGVVVADRVAGSEVLGGDRGVVVDHVRRGGAGHRGLLVLVDVGLAWSDGGAVAAGQVGGDVAGQVVVGAALAAVPGAAGVADSEGEVLADFLEAVGGLGVDVAVLDLDGHFVLRFVVLIYGQR